MKKIVLFAIIASLILLNFTSCKKGENDPTISLRSRKARLVGDWKLKEGLAVTTLSNGEIETVTYNGLEKVIEKTGQPTQTKTFTCELDVRKDGSYTWTTYDDQDLRIIEGTWYFGSKNKELDIKNKETLCLITEKHTTATSGGTPNVIEMSGTQALGYPVVWQIDRLANDELVILTDFTYSTISGTATSKGTLTYRQD